MDQNPPQSPPQGPLKESRPPINLRIKFRSETVVEFIERYAVDVSRGGIFIRTKEPLAVGTQLKLDFQFQNGGALMSGDGTVVWIREFDPNRSNVPPGMGVRFDKLTPESQGVLEQLLAEKAKRERGGVPGSGTGAPTVRRPSSMFSVLEPQVSVSESSTSEKSGSDAVSDESGKTAAAAPRSGGVGLAPLVGASSGTGPRAVPPSSNPPSPAGNFFAGKTTPRPSQRPTPTDEGAPFGIHDEPTQIAGKIPAFLSTLSTEREAAASAASTLAKRVGKEVSKSADGDSGLLSPAANAAGASESGRVKGDAATGAAANKSDATDAIASVPDAAAHATLSRDQLLPLGSVSPKGASRDTVRDLPAEVADAGASASAPAKAPVAAASSVSSDAAASIAPTAATASPATAVARSKDARKRSPAALVGVSVLVLGGAALFLVRFFGSHATEPAMAPPSPATVTAAEPTSPSIPPSAPAVPSPAPPPAAAAAKPGAGAPTPGGTAAPAAAANAGSAGDTTAKAAPSAAATATAPTGDGKSDDSAAATAHKATKHKPARSPRDTASAPGGAEIAQAETKPAEAPAAAGAAATAPGAEAAADTEAAGHEIRVTSKPVGAEVALDGQTVGKTPYSVGIADVSAPHFIAVRKDGFEPFEQMISASSAWSKTKGAKGKAALQVLKISAKLKQVGGAEPKSATEPPAAGGEAPAKAEGQRADRPLPPSDQGAPVGNSP